MLTTYSNSASALLYRVSDVVADITNRGTGLLHF